MSCGFGKRNFQISPHRRPRPVIACIERKDVEMVMKIKELLYDRGFTIAGARRQLVRIQAECAQQSATKCLLTCVRNELRDDLDFARTENLK